MDSAVLIAAPLKQLNVLPLSSTIVVEPLVPFRCKATVRKARLGSQAVSVVTLKASDTPPIVTVALVAVLTDADEMT